MIMYPFRKNKTEEQRLCELEARLCRLQKANNIVQVTADYSVLINDRLMVINTLAANAGDITVPDPTKHKGRPLEIVNFSGASQNLLSHDGTSLTIKTITGSAVATHAVENSTSLTTGRRNLRSDGTFWILTSI